MVGVVNKDDHIYFSHKSGPKSGRVLCHGKHGAVVRCDENKRHKVRWEQVLGHKERVEHKLKMVDRGEDGAIVEHEDGRRAFVAGEIPKAAAYQDKAATFEPPGDGDLVTRGIERAMGGQAVYQVIDGEIPGGNVIVAAEKPLELVKFLAEHKFEPDYEIAPRVVVRNGEESGRGGLVVFDAEDDEVEGLVNAIAAFQRRGVGFDEVVVMGRQVDGMAPVTVSTKKISGKTVLVFGERQGFDAVEAFASPDMVERMRKSLVFFKAHIKGYMRRDGTYVAAHDNNVGKDASPVLISEWEREKEGEPDERGKEFKKSHGDGQVDHGQRREAGRSGLRPAGVQEPVRRVSRCGDAGTDQKANRRKAGSLKKAVIYFKAAKRRSVFARFAALLGIK